VAGIAGAPGKIVIVGDGAAGFAAAEILRRQEFRGGIVMLSSDTRHRSTGRTFRRTISRQRA